MGVEIMGDERAELFTRLACEVEAWAAFRRDVVGPFVRSEGPVQWKWLNLFNAAYYRHQEAEDRREVEWVRSLLRGPELAASVDLDGEGDLIWPGQPDGVDDLLRRVVTVRSDLVIQEGLEIPAEPSGSGRFLLHWPANRGADGMAESEGWFDGLDLPPPATWVAWVDGEDALDLAEPSPFLVAWVPGWAVEYAQRGLDVEAHGALGWMDDGSWRP